MGEATHTGATMEGGRGTQGGGGGRGEVGGKGVGSRGRAEEV